MRGGPERRALRRWRACPTELAGVVSSGGSGAETWAQKTRGAPAKRRQASAGLARGCGALQRVRHGELRRQRRRSGDVRRSRLRGGLLALGPSATGRGNRASAHRARFRRRCGAEGVGDEARAAALGRSQRRVEARGLRTSGRRGTMWGVPARLEGESGRAKSHRRRVIPVKCSPVAAELGEVGQSGVRLWLRR